MTMQSPGTVSPSECLVFDIRLDSGCAIFFFGHWVVNVGASELQRLTKERRRNTQGSDREKNGYSKASKEDVLRRMSGLGTTVWQFSLVVVRTSCVSTDMLLKPR